MLRTSCTACDAAAHWMEMSMANANHHQRIIAKSQLTLTLLPGCAGRADYFGLVLNRSARVQGAAHGGQVLAEGLAVDKAVQEWRAMCPQKKQQSSSRMRKYTPGDHPCATRAPHWTAMNAL
jgi:class 3 adenylate cyclase